MRLDLRTCAAAGKELAQSGWKVERVREAAAGIDLQCFYGGEGGRPARVLWGTVALVGCLGRRRAVGRPLFEPGDCKSL